MDQSGLVAKRGVDAEDLDQIKSLAEECEHFDGVRVKFNWEMIEHRSASGPSDFCCYRDGLLVGYMPLDGFGNQYEITAAVLPDYRRQGIFRALFEAARQEAENRHAAELLLVGYRASASGNAVVKRMNFVYKSSEYCMKAEAASIPALTETRIWLDDVTPSNVAELSHAIEQAFGYTSMNAPETLLEELANPNKRFFLARVNDTLVGQIGVLTQESGVYIRAVGILPDWRKQGLGRQMLAMTVHKMLAEGHRHFELDVATDNSRALSIYESCGFRETTVYDYYSVPVAYLPKTQS